MKPFFTPLFFLFTILINAQPGPPGLQGIEAIDYDNDGYALFDIGGFLNGKYNFLVSEGYDMSGYQLLFYPSVSDCQNNSNATGNAYTNVVLNQVGSFNYIYIGNGPVYTFTHCDFLGLSVIPGNLDSDNDGIINSQENADPSNIANDDTDGDGMPNFRDADDDGDGVPTLEEDYNADGNYQNDDVNANGIADYRDAAAALGVPKLATQNLILSPNPAHGSLNISVANGDPLTHLAIFDIQGRMVFNTDKVSKTISLENLKPGLFLVRAGASNKTYFQKLIIE